MGVIPEFQRRKLASSVVGTAGADQSGQIIGNAVSQAAGQVANTAYGIAVERQEAKDAALANKTLIDFDMKAAQTFQAHQDEFAEFRGDKAERVKAFQTKADELFKATAEAIPSRGARDIFDKHGYSVMKGYIDKELSASDMNQANLTLTDTTDAVNLLAQRAASVGRDTGADIMQKRAALTSLLKQGETTYAVAGKVLSAEQREKLKSAIPESISKGFLLSTMERNPEQVVQMLEDGSFDKLLSANDKTKMIKDAREALPKVQERRQIDVLLGGITQNQGLWDKYVNRDPSLLSDLEQRDDEFSVALRDLALKGDPDPVNQANDIMRLTAKFESLTEKNWKGEEKKNKFGKKASLEELTAVMTDVVRSQLPTDTKNAFLKKLSEPLYDKIKLEHKQNATQPQNTLSPVTQPQNILVTMGLSVINQWFARNDRSKDIDAKAKVVLNYLNNFDARKVSNQSEASTLARSALRQNAQDENPGLGLVAGTPNKVLRADTSQVIVQEGESDVKDRVKIPAKSAPQVFKVGDERDKDGVTYVRQQDGQWRPKKKS